jgi:hypothetical protein
MEPPVSNGVDFAET